MLVDQNRSDQIIFGALPHSGIAKSYYDDDGCICKLIFWETSIKSSAATDTTTRNKYLCTNWATNERSNDECGLYNCGLLLQQQCWQSMIDDFATMRFPKTHHFATIITTHLCLMHGFSSSGRFRYNYFNLLSSFCSYSINCCTFGSYNKHIN